MYSWLVSSLAGFSVGRSFGRFACQKSVPLPVPRQSRRTRKELSGPCHVPDDGFYASGLLHVLPLDRSVGGPHGQCLHPSVAERRLLLSLRHGLPPHWEDIETLGTCKDHVETSTASVSIGSFLGGISSVYVRVCVCV